MHPRLEEISKLKDNWDEYGSPAIDPGIIAVADTFISQFKDVETFIYPMFGGGVELVFSADELDLTLYLYSSGRFEFLFNTEFLFSNPPELDLSKPSYSLSRSLSRLSTWIANHFVPQPDMELALRNGLNLNWTVTDDTCLNCMGIGVRKEED